METVTEKFCPYCRRKQGKEHKDDCSRNDYAELCNAIMSSRKPCCGKVIGHTEECPYGPGKRV